MKPFITKDILSFKNLCILSLSVIIFALLDTVGKVPLMAQQNSNNAEVTIFAKKYVREYGKPHIVENNFAVLEPGDDFLLLVQNGEDGKHRINYAVISINGQQVIGPDELNQQINFITKFVTLEKDNVIAVELRSEPDSFINVDIIQAAFPDDNNPPVITSTPVTTATEDSLYIYDVEATDPDVGDALTYYLAISPAGMAIDSATGLINWTPINEQVGDNSVVVEVIDTSGAKDTQSFTITVVNINDPPVITSIPITTATEDSLYIYDVDAIDPDVGDVLTYYLAISPAGMTIDSVTGLINWTPTNEQVGDNSVVVQVDDGMGGDDIQFFTITVVNTNDSPVITSTPVTAAIEGELYIYDVDATDPDVGDVLTYSLTTSPTGMNIDAVTGLIQWIPTKEQVGDNDVTVQVRDVSDATDTQSFTIIAVEVANNPPVITSTPLTTGTEGVLYEYDVEATDADDDPLTFSLTLFLEGMTVDEMTGLITWTPSETQAGSHHVTVEVSDGRGGSDTQSFTIDVAEAINNPPVITSNPLTTGTEGVLYEYDVEATDADDDPLTFSLALFPEGMVIDEITGLITWTPSETQAGSHHVTVEVSDGRGGSDTQSFTIDVAEAINNPPVITSNPLTTGAEGILYEYGVEATDADDDPLTFSLTLFPEGMVIDEITGLITWTPSETQAGSHHVTVEVSDGRGGSDSQSFIIDVLGPIIRPIADSPQLAGGEFIIDIEVENVRNLLGIAFVFNYDTKYIDAIEAEKGDFLGNDVIFLEPVIDDIEGTVSIGITRKHPADGVDGNGVVAKVKVKSAATAPDGISVGFTITEIDAADPDGTTIPFTPEELTVEIISPCVWPGDTDNDGKVDQVDVLPIGLYWGVIGPARPDASLEWECQSAKPWNPEEATYTDADGDGIINQSDVLPIGVNWGRTHDVSDLASDFWLQPVSDVKPSVIKPIIIRRPFNNRFTVNINVQRVSDLFGIAFALQYTPTDGIGPLAVEAGGFLGEDVVFYHNIDEAKGTIHSVDKAEGTIHNVDETKGTIRIGVTRKRPQSGVNGSGIVAKITFQSDRYFPEVRLTIKDITAIDSDGRIIPFVSNGSVETAQESPDNGRWLASSPQAPIAPKLSQNFPNPFNPETWIPFQLSETANVTIGIYDSSGRLIRVINLGEKQAGFYTSKETAAYWNGRNINGEVVASGVYFYTIRAGKFFAQKKMIIVR